MPYISLKKNEKLNLNFKPDNSLHKNKEKNKIKYLDFKEKLLKKCNSKIVEKRDILPILSHRSVNNINNSSFSQKKNNKRDSINYSSKTPFKIQKKFTMPRKLSILSNFSHLNENEKNKLSEFSMRIRKSINLRKNDLIFNKLILNHSNNSEEKRVIENNNNKKKNKKRKIFSPFKYSEFFHRSKERNVSAKQIYEHYISKEYHQHFHPIDNFTKFLEIKFKSPQNKLNKLYGINESYINNIEEIKNNNSIAFKEDFNIQEYQKILVGMVKKRISKNILFDLQQNFQKFNDKILNGFAGHKGRYTKLAESLRESAPIFLINKLKKLDNDKKIEKAKYFKINLIKKKEEENPLEEFEFYLENKYKSDMEK
jgi:hypothetical protein